jgi:hypothetical protein
MEPVAANLLCWDVSVNVKREMLNATVDRAMLVRVGVVGDGDGANAAGYNESEADQS